LGERRIIPQSYPFAIHQKISNATSPTVISGSESANPIKTHCPNDFSPRVPATSGAASGNDTSSESCVAIGVGGHRLAQLVALPFELNVHHPSKAFVVFNNEYSSRAHNGSTGYVASQSEVPISYLKYSHDAVWEVKCF
jgi:hypothetical protein